MFESQTEAQAQAQATAQYTLAVLWGHEGIADPHMMWSA